MMSILDTLKQKSLSNYAKVARRMRTAVQIADAMEAAGLSKKQFAEKLGKQPSEITKWLSGTHNFTSDTLSDISIVLGVEITGADKHSLLYKIVDTSYNVLAKCSQPLSKTKTEVAGRKSEWSDIPYSLLINNTNRAGYGCKC
ncbi:MAG: helix-turn-helix transcriptional regulator [Alistipes sp.]